MGFLAVRTVGGWDRARRVAGAALGLVLLVLLPPLAGCESAGVSPESPAAAGPEPVVDVEAAPVRLGSIRRSISAPGSLVAVRESRIGAELQARIERVSVSEGDRVKAGDVLFELDPQLFEIALRQASAGLDLARAERRQFEADLARARTLQKNDVVPEQEIERLVTSLAVARARERQAAAAEAKARHDLERTVVRAPYAGSIAARLVDEGTTALVQPQTIVVVLQETTELEARAAIPESELATVQVGDEALIRVEGLAAAIRSAVSAVSDTIDDATRTYLVTMRVPNPDHRLKAGVFAEVEILPRPRTNVPLVPREALRTEEGRTRLLVVRDGRAEAVAVEVGLVAEDAVEILGGVEVGEPVLVGEAARTIAPGLRVRVVAPRERAAS